LARFSSATKKKSAPRCSLFDLPLPLPSDSLYREMDLEPSATTEEVGWAVKILNDKRQAAKSQLDDDIKATVAKVPGLSVIYEELSGASGASTGNERKLQKLAELKNRALDIDPGFKEKQRKSKEYADKINALNALDLGKLAGLAKYDEMHPPYILMKLAPAVRDEFLDQNAGTCDCVHARTCCGNSYCVVLQPYADPHTTTRYTHEYCKHWFGRPKRYKQYVADNQQLPRSSIIFFDTRKLGHSNRDCD